MSHIFPNASELLDSVFTVFVSGLALVITAMAIFAVGSSFWAGRK